MHREITREELSYVKWQNSAFQWYLGSRLLIFESHLRVAAYSTQQTIELLLKATLIYWDKNFKPKEMGHDFNVLLERLRKSVVGAGGFEIPGYLLRYQSVSRYIDEKNGNIMGFPDSLIWIDDLDNCFCKFIELVPFQFNTNLVHMLTSIGDKHFEIFIRDNKQDSNLRRILQRWLRDKPTGLAPFPKDA